MPLGLVLEGSSSRSTLLRLPSLARELGPVKSSAIRLARRFSNLMQGGYPVVGYEELQMARLIFIRVPDSSVARLVQELCASDLVFKRLCFVLCETWLCTDALNPLRERGASVATLLNLPTTERNIFVVEGQAIACRLTRRLIERHEGRVFELKMGTKHLLYAAELLSAVLAAPLFTAAQQSLRAAGISGNQLAALLEYIAEEMTREVIRGVRLPLGSLPPDSSSELGSAFLNKLRQTQPAVAALIETEQSGSAKLVSAVWKNAIDGG
ncbi:MAG TPA: DUF2520 domain-containing protein [Bryobacteraceae bacterium]|nr:DUF2520 domain-containing protein [Bryobacteraceae bacterium]